MYIAHFPSTLNSGKNLEKATNHTPQTALLSPTCTGATSASSNSTNSELNETPGAGN